MNRTTSAVAIVTSARPFRPTTGILAMGPLVLVIGLTAFSSMDSLVQGADAADTESAPANKDPDGAAQPKKEPKQKKEVQFEVKAKSGGKPIKFASLAVISQDGAVVTLQTDEEGIAGWEKVQADGPFLVFVACKGFSAATIKVPRKAATKVTLRSAGEGAGSVVISTSGSIPGLNATLSPQLDPRKGTVLSGFSLHH